MLRRQYRKYSQNKDLAVKTRTKQLQKQIKDELRIATQANWEKFCNFISLENDPNESWRKIKNVLKAKDQRDYPTLRHDHIVAKTNADKAQLFAESVERNSRGGGGGGQLPVKAKYTSASPVYVYR